MNIKLALLLLIITITQQAQGSSLNITKKLIENLPFILMATDEDDAYFKKYEQLINCVANKSAEKLPQEQLNEFNLQLEAHAVEVEQATNDIEKLMKLGPPQPNKTLVNYIKQIRPIVEQCETKHDVKVEF